MHYKQVKLIIVTLCSMVVALAQQQYLEKKQFNVFKPLVLSSNNFDGNRIECDIENNGMFVSHRVSGRSGLSWPKGNGTQTVFASGLWLGGKINGEVRVTAAEYSGELASGPWGADHDDEKYKIYKVNKSDLSNPLDSEDFQNWPAELGAPWIDNDNNGVYEPLPDGPDHPDFIGDQVLWMVMNDGVTDLHSVFQTDPLGIEIQRTVYGFDNNDALGDVMFVKDLIFNKGGNIIKDIYLGLWSDVDLGDASDDFVGCDTTLNLGICYNDGPDANFANYINGTPAIGYDLIQGPKVLEQGESATMFGRTIQNYKNLNMTAFVKYT